MSLKEELSPAIHSYSSRQRYPSKPSDAPTQAAG